MADDMDFAVRQRPEDIEVEEREIADIVDPLGRIAVAEPRMIGREHRKSLGQLCEHVGPVRQALHAVQEEERLAPSVTPQEKFRASYVDKSLIHQKRLP
jgi:hypothetical protein